MDRHPLPPRRRLHSRTPSRSSALAACVLMLMTGACATGSSPSFTMAPIFFAETVAEPVPETGPETVDATGTPQPGNRTGEAATQLAAAPVSLDFRAVDPPRFLLAGGNALLPTGAFGSGAQQIAMLPTNALLGAQGSAALGPVGLGATLTPVRLADGGIAITVQTNLDGATIAPAVIAPVVSAVAAVVPALATPAAGIVEPVLAAVPSVTAPVATVATPVIAAVKPVIDPIVATLPVVTAAVIAPVAAIAQPAIAPIVAPVVAQVTGALPAITMPVTAIAAPAVATVAQPAIAPAVTPAITQIAAAPVTGVAGAAVQPVAAVLAPIAAQPLVTNQPVLAPSVAGGGTINALGLLNGTATVRACLLGGCR